MKKTEIVLATRNAGKIKEFASILKGFPVEILGLNEFGPIPEPVEDGSTFEENAYKKALFTAKVLGLPAIADDSGLVVEALEGAPGVLSARYAGEKATDAENISKLLAQMQDISNRAAAFECALSLAVPSGPALTYEGRCVGEILPKPRGTGGFGYDPVFLYPPLGKTFAEIALDEKNRFSHRGLALMELAREFDKVLFWIERRLAEVKPPKPDHREFEHDDWSTLSD